MTPGNPVGACPDVLSVSDLIGVFHLRGSKTVLSMLLVVLRLAPYVMTDRELPDLLWLDATADNAGSEPVPSVPLMSDAHFKANNHLCEGRGNRWQEPHVGAQFNEVGECSRIGADCLLQQFPRSQMGVKRVAFEPQEERLGVAPTWSDPTSPSPREVSNCCIRSRQGGVFADSHSPPSVLVTSGFSTSQNLGAVTTRGALEHQLKQGTPKMSDNSRRELQESSHGPFNITSKVGHTSDHDTHIWTERERRKKMNSMFSTLHSLLPSHSAKADKSTIVDEAISYIQTLKQTREELNKRRFEASAGAGAHLLVRNPVASRQDRMIVASCKTPLQQAAEPVQLGGSASNPVSAAPLEETRCMPRNFSGPGQVQAGGGNPIFQTLSSPNVVLNVCGHDAFISICSARQPCLLSQILFVMEKHKLFVMNAHINSTHTSSLYMIHAQPVDETCEDLGDEHLKTTLEDLSNCLLSVHLPHPI